MVLIMFIATAAATVTFVNVIDGVVIVLDIVNVAVWTACCAG